MIENEVSPQKGFSLNTGKQTLSWVWRSAHPAAQNREFGHSQELQASCI